MIAECSNQHLTNVCNSPFSEVLLIEIKYRFSHSDRQNISWDIENDSIFNEIICIFSLLMINLLQICV